MCGTSSMVMDSRRADPPASRAIRASSRTTPARTILAATVFMSLHSDHKMIGKARTPNQFCQATTMPAKSRGFMQSNFKHDSVRPEAQCAGEGSNQRLDLDPTEPDLGKLDLDRDLAARQRKELAWVLRVRLLQFRDRVDGSTIHDVGRPITLPDDLHDIPVVQVFKVAVLDHPAGHRLGLGLILCAGGRIARLRPTMLRTETLPQQASTMAPLNAANPVDEKEIAHIAFLNLALHTGRPYRICADQTIQQAVIAFGDGA